MTETRRWGKAGVRLDSEQARKERAEANKARLLAEGRQRTQAARAAAASTIPSAQSRGYERYLERRELEVARQAWQQGRVIPYRITTALDIRALYGPEVDQACGVEEPAVDQWEAGELYPTWEQLLALAELTQFPVKFFTNMLECTPIDASDTSMRFHVPGCDERAEVVLAFTPEAIAAHLGGVCPTCRQPRGGHA